MKLNLSILLVLSFSVFGVSQEYQEELLQKKWYFCDTTFYYNHNEIILLTNDENHCKKLVNSKSGSLDLRHNEVFVLMNYAPCEQPVSIKDGLIVDWCFSIIDGTVRVFNSFIWLNDIKFYIDAIDEDFLLLRMAINDD
jgi:hypothetical protein